MEASIALGVPGDGRSDDGAPRSTLVRLLARGPGVLGVRAVRTGINRPPAVVHVRNCAGGWALSDNHIALDVPDEGRIGIAARCTVVSAR